MSKIAYYRDGAWLWFDRGDLRSVSANTPRVYLQTDTLSQDLYHHAAKRHFDSKSAFRAATRNHGCIELGNDQPVQTATLASDPKEVKADVIKAYQKNVWNN